MFPAFRSSACLRSATAVATLLLGSAAAFAAESKGVQVERFPNRVEIRIDGQPFTDLRFADTPKPYFYPLLAHGGIPVTRHFPMRTDTTDEDKDHPHHRSLWFTHGDVNGIDFWAEGPTKGRVVQQEILETKGGPHRGILRTSNLWMTHDGRRILTDETHLVFHRREFARSLDYSITLKASEGVDLTFGDTKEGTMALRLAESMRLKPNKHYAGKPPGTILQDSGGKDGNTWGKRASWTAYSGPVQDRTLSVVMFDHPSNPRFPTWWHVRDYGLFAANPFGVHDFEKKPAGTGNLVVKAGDQVTFKYRIVIHAGNIRPADLATEAADFARDRVAR